MTTYVSSPAENLLAYLPDSMAGFKVAWASNTTLTVTSGTCRDSAGVYDMYLPSTTTINTAVVGLNGIDTGTLAASTVYAVHLVNDASGHVVPGVIVSTSITAPVLPAGYSIFRRIGWAVTDSSTHFLKIVQSGTGMIRRYEFDTLQRILNAGTVGTDYTAIDCSAFLPAVQDMPLGIQCAFTPNTAGNVLYVRQTGSASSTSPAMSADVKSVATSVPLTVLAGIASSKAKIDYKVTENGTDSATIYLQYFVDYV